MKLTAKLKKAIQAHAAEVYPEECCGVIVGKEYIRCKNIAPTVLDANGNIIQDKTTNFEPCPVDSAKAEDLGEIKAYVHSHPDATARASHMDLLQIELHKKPWVICAYPDVEFQIYKPCGYKAPLVGRAYMHGVQDCFSIVRDFYSRELDINIPDYERHDKWWEQKESASLYVENFQKEGFIEVDQPQYGDVLLCRIGRTEHVNHAVIWLGNNGELKSEQADPCIGSTLILHHPYGRNSTREIFGSQWQERVEKVVRYVKNN